MHCHFIAEGDNRIVEHADGRFLFDIHQDMGKGRLMHFSGKLNVPESITGQGGKVGVLFMLLPEDQEALEKYPNHICVPVFINTVQRTGDTKVFYFSTFHISSKNHGENELHHLKVTVSKDSPGFNDRVMSRTHFAIIFDPAAALMEDTPST